MVADQTSAQSPAKPAEKKKKSAGNTYAWMESFEGTDAGAQKAEETSAEPAVDLTSEDSIFAKMFESSLTDGKFTEGEVIPGTVLRITPEAVVVDIGYKCEGQVRAEEFRRPDGSMEVEVGQRINVLLESLDSEHGYVRLSKDRAEVIKAWDEIARACDAGDLLEGTVMEKVKGGFIVDIGVKAFLPASQLDVRPSRNLDSFIGKRLKFKIVKFSRKRGNIVLSHKAVLMEEKDRLKAETLSALEEGQLITGTVKNITDYGAFIDLGGMDGLLHITDMSWGRVKHPSEIFSVGDQITVKILKYDREKERVSLGLKQVSANPWDELADKISVGDRVKGKVVSVKDYGAFVELAEGIEGLIHISEMSYRRDLKHPSSLLKPEDEIECMVLEIDPRNKRLSLGIKQLQENPWELLQAKCPPGTKVEGEVKSVTDFGVFVDIGEGVDGLIHISDMSWTKKIAHPSERFNKGDRIQAVVLSVDKDHEKFSLGIKQLDKDPWETAAEKYRVGAVIEGKITKVADFGAFVALEEGIEGLIYVSELTDHRIEKASEAAKVGDLVKAEVTSIDLRDRKIGLSIRRLKASEERKNYEQYSAKSDKKTSLGDVLGSRLKGMLASEEVAPGVGGSGDSDGDSNKS